jgi:hypothetical protein
MLQRHSTSGETLRGCSPNWGTRSCISWTLYPLHADCAEAELLALPQVPVIRQYRMIRTDDDQPVEVSVLVKGAQLYELVYRQPA